LIIFTIKEFVDEGEAFMEEINLHGLNLEEARHQLENRLDSACRHGETVIRIIHGQGKHSEYFPVLKSFVRRWLIESEFARLKVDSVFRGEDGSPYTVPNAGETVIVLKGVSPSVFERELSFEEEEEQEARRNAKGIRADRLRTARRRMPRR
jgi:hypothetical protein